MLSETRVLKANKDSSKKWGCDFYKCLEVEGVEIIFCSIEQNVNILSWYSMSEEMFDFFFSPYCKHIVMSWVEADAHADKLLI